MGVSPYIGKGMKTTYFVLMALPHHTRLMMFLKKLVQYYKFHPWPFGTGIKCLVGAAEDQY